MKPLRWKIEIPFNDWSKARLRLEQKTATSRTKAYGAMDDYFEVDGTVYVITSVTKERLIDIADHCYEAEGCKTPNEFVKIWNEIHPIKRFDPEQIVFYHQFKKVACDNDN